MSPSLSDEARRRLLDEAPDLIGRLGRAYLRAPLASARRPGKAAYKTEFSPPDDRQLVRLLSAVGLAQHIGCVDALVGTPATRWATVPSRKGRSKHPLHDIAVELTRDLTLKVPLESGGIKNDRQVREDNFQVPDGISAAGQHVLLLEDTWTSGASVQSVVLALRAAGAAHVSALIIARWLDPQGVIDRDFCRELVPLDYELQFCPWTASNCPA